MEINQKMMDLGTRRGEIEAIIGRDITDDEYKYKIENIPENIALEVDTIWVKESQGLLAMLYLRYLTGESIPAMKEYGESHGWLHGHIE